jgi:hypothetical protein
MIRFFELFSSNNIISDNIGKKSEIKTSSSLIPFISSSSFSPRFSLLLSLLSSFCSSPFSEIWAFSLLRSFSLLHILLIKKHPYSLHVLGFQFLYFRFLFNFLGCIYKSFVNIPSSRVSEDLEALIPYSAIVTDFVITLFYNNETFYSFFNYLPSSSPSSSTSISLLPSIFSIASKSPQLISSLSISSTLSFHASALKLTSVLILLLYLVIYYFIYMLFSFSI